MRRTIVRLLVAGLSLTAGTVALTGTAFAKPGPGFDPQIDDITIFEPCWKLPQGCVIDPGDPGDPVDPTDDPQPEPEQPTDPGTPADPGDPGAGGGTPNGGTQTGGGTPSGAGTETVESTPSTEAVPVAEQAAADEETSDSSAIKVIAFGLLGAALLALVAVAVLRRRSRALS